MKVAQRQLVATARITGVWYLMLAIAGMFGFLMIHPRIFIANDHEKTLANLTEQESLARIRLLLELAIVTSQALLAVWFFKLFKRFDDWSAWALAAWGMMNSAVIMISAIAMSSVIEIANSSIQSHDDKIALVQLLERVITNAWGVGGLFFGLWLIPMGYVVTKSKRMPAWLGRILMAGGIGYILNTAFKYAGINHPAVDSLVILATVGEFWMIAYLLIYGIRITNED